MTGLPRRADTILLVDDEPYNLSWLTDFIEYKRLKVLNAVIVDGALDVLGRARYRVVVVDLNIPLHAPELATDPLQQRYPGLIVASHARTIGHLGRQVIVYSVHDDDLVRAYAARLGCTYLLKGRPRQFKQELDDVLSYDPLNQ